MALTIQRKRQIDILLPTLLATVAGIMVFRKKAGEYRLLIAAVIGAFLLGYIITSQITKIMYSSGPAAVPVDGAAQLYDGLPLATRLMNDIYSWGFRDYDPYNELMKLTDGQLKQVYNAWNKNFFAKDNETLPTAISGENFGIVNDTLKQNVLARFQTLGLN